MENKVSPLETTWVFIGPDACSLVLCTVPVDEEAEKDVSAFTGAGD